jgi:hypothetical protein
MTVGWAAVHCRRAWVDAMRGSPGEGTDARSVERFRQRLRVDDYSQVGQDLIG